ncbi:MAG: TlpA disulfide reductase family protein [Acidimicrobiia bacterium]
MTQLTATIVDGEQTVETPARIDGPTLVIDGDDLERATGWHLESQGLCRGDVCVPARDRAALEVEGGVSLREVARLLGRPLAVELGGDPVAVLGEPGETYDRSHTHRDAPAFTLPDIDGSPVALDDFAGRKRVIVAWAPWCGCRYDLPVWDALQAELGDDVAVISIALEEDPAEARRWARDELPEALSYPVLVDRDHVVAERYGITNVPMTVWIDEDGKIVRPPLMAPGDDQFRDFTKIDSSLHHDALRKWVRDDVAPLSDDELEERHTEPTPELQAARTERRLAMYLLRADRPADAERHLAAALELAPDDFTIQRGTMPLRGEDPFGDAFFEFWEAWDARGRPGYASA